MVIYIAERAASLQHNIHERKKDLHFSHTAVDECSPPWATLLAEWRQEAPGSHTYVKSLCRHAVAA